MSNLSCRVGDLAIIVRADNDPQALGAIVKVLALRIAQESLGWEVDPKFFWYDDVGQPHEVMWDDRDLRPIRPDADPVAVERAEPVKASTC
jgi:hypothetical protein